MILTRQDLIAVREYVAEGNSRDSERLERRLTDEIGDKDEYYDAGEKLEELITLLEDSDRWRLVELAESILSNEVVAELPEGFPKYELRSRDGGEIEVIVQEANGCDFHSYGHTNVLNQLIAYNFLKVK